MFNSPLHYCPVCREYVPLDQSRRECAREHGCMPEACPLAHLFSAPETAVSALSETPDATPVSGPEPMASKR
jgi:hypothetical protein